MKEALNTRVSFGGDAPGCLEGDSWRKLGVIWGQVLEEMLESVCGLTAADGVVVLRELAEEQHLLLGQLQALLLHQVHLLLGFEGLLGHHQVLLQHALLLLPPLSPRVLNLGRL